MRFSRRTSPFLTLAAVASLLSVATAAATTTAPLPALSTADSNTDGTNTAAADTNTGAATTKQTNTGKQTTTATGAVITGGGAGVTLSGTVPSITGGGNAATGFTGLPTDLPTLAGGVVVVAPSVPPTADAPYMQMSSVPEGTVFIAVGAILGFLAMSVMLWRGLVAWSLHRSIKRASMDRHVSDSKRKLTAPIPPFYKYSDRESTISLSAMGHKGGRKSGRPSTGGPRHGSTSSLFFSPTAGAGAGLNSNNVNRGSNYLPAGYYAAGASAPGNGQGMAHIGSNGPPIGLSNLGPQTQGYPRTRSMGPSPPDSPALHAHSHAASASISTVNMSQAAGDQRAPSVYLEDLFDGEGGGASMSPHRGAGAPRGQVRF